MMFPWLSMFDLGTVRANFIKPIDISKNVYRNNNYAVLVPIFNDVKYLTNLDFLKKFGDRVILCTTTNEKPEFVEKLREISQKYGLRLNFSEVGSGKKNPWAIYNKTLLAHDAVLKSSISQIVDEYVIFIDGDTFVDGDFANLTGIVEQHGFDIASVKVLPSRRQTLIEKLQGIEYDIAMQARLIYPWLTSGAGMIAKREVMVNIMKNHSLFFNGGDIEIGKLADMMGYKVGHVPMTFYTDVPETISKWVKQRFSWMCGCFRHSIINIEHNLKHPFHFIYFSFVIYFLYPIKIYEMFIHWYLLPIIISLYALLTYIANWKVRSKWMLVFPFYALFQVLVIIWFGIYRYLVTVIRSRNIGRIRMSHNPNKVSFFNPQFTYKYLKSYFVSGFGIFAIMLGTNNAIQGKVLGQRYETLELAQVGGQRVLAASESAFTNLAKLSEQDPQMLSGTVAGYSTGRVLDVAVLGNDTSQTIAYKLVMKYVETNGICIDAKTAVDVAQKLSEDSKFPAVKKCPNIISINSSLIESYFR